VGIKDGWEVRKLGDVCEKTVNIKWQEYENQVFQYIDLSSVSRTTLTINETSKITSKNAPSRAKKIIRQNDVIFATTRPTLKRVTIVPVKFDNQICSTGYSVLRNNSDFILPKYIFYFLRSEVFMQRMENLQRGTSYPAVTDKDVKSTQIPIPPLTEQKQIVALLDQTFAAIDQAIANLEKNIQNAQELFQSKLNDVFSQRGEGWVEKSLGEVCDIKTGKLNANAMVDSGKYTFFTCSRETFQIDKYAFDCEAILLAGNNASGDFNVKHFKGKFNAYQRTYVITTKEDNVINYRFLKYRLEHHLKRFKEQSVGANTRFLKIGMIKTVPIQLPSFSVQKNIVNNLDQLSEKIHQADEKYNERLKNLEELKKSILQKAFNGELT